MEWMPIWRGNLRRSADHKIEDNGFTVVLTTGDSTTVDDETGKEYVTAQYFGIDEQGNKAQRHYMTAGRPTLMTNISGGKSEAGTDRKSVYKAKYWYGRSNNLLTYFKNGLMWYDRILNQPNKQKEITETIIKSMIR